MTYKKNAIWIETRVELVQLVELLSKEPCIAIDTESNSLFAYKEQVCLIQFTIPSGDYLVDPLAIDDLSPLGPIFSDPGIEKIFHAVEYDVICLKRDFGFTFNHIFDTMIGARTLGWKKIGLGALLEEHFQVKANKKYQRANWGARPLEAKMLEYARTDTHYLIALRDIIQKELLAAGRWELANEYFQQMAHVAIPEPVDPIMACWRSCRQWDFSKKQLNALYELCSYREFEAKKMNRPPFKVLNKEILVDVAMACPKDREMLSQSVRLTRRQMDRFGGGLIRAVQRGLTGEPRSFKRNHSYPEEPYHTNLDVLRNWRKLKARDLGVESDVVLSRDILEMIADKDPQNALILKEIMASVPVRYEQFGRSILESLEKVRIHP